MQITKTEKLAKGYLENIKKSIDSVSMDEIDTLAMILYHAYKAGKKVIVMGNGGSAATASHFVCDLAKGTAFSEKKRFKAIALCDNIPMVTAYANDRSYEDIFSEQLKNVVEEGDVVIGISASGNSENVLNALRLAGTCGAVTVGLTGFQGGKLKKLVSECLVVPDDNMERIEDVHLIIMHVLKLLLRSRIEADR